MGKNYDRRPLSHDGFPHPTFNRLAHFAQPAFEEMIRAFDQHNFFGSAADATSASIAPVDQTDRALR